MWKMRIATVITILLLMASPLFALEGATVELGKQLFESTQLGSKGRSCQSCHSQGEGLDKIGDFNDEELKDIINACIRDALGGKLISADSQEMDSLLHYVRTFQKN